MVIDVDHERPIEAGDAGASQVAALHDDRGVEFTGDLIRDHNPVDARKLPNRAGRCVFVDDRDVLAERLQRIGHRQLRADRIAIRA